MKFPALFFLLLQTGYMLSTKPVKLSQKSASPSGVSFKLDSLSFYDVVRKRVIPVAVYIPETAKQASGRPVVIFSHGYGDNKGGDNVAYSYLTEFLATQGYFVASVQHELPTDELLPTTGKPQEVRRPNWERGVRNILFVLNELKQREPLLNYKRLTLIGHSNGGDMSILFAHLYPQYVNKIITLDNRRMPFPRGKKPRIYSLRSTDQSADEGVLPTPDEQKKYGMKIIQLKNTLHNDMDNHANAAQRQEINAYILNFLKDGDFSQKRVYRGLARKPSPDAAKARSF
ncbi:MAG: alpha/beta hydrolase [Spirosomataceae bacterium]